MIIGSIDKILCFNEGIFILNNKSSKKVLQYDNNGKLLCQIGQFGKGPGEYDLPDDMSIDWIGKGPGEYVNPDNIDLSPDEDKILVNNEWRIFLEYSV